MAEVIRVVYEIQDKLYGDDGNLELTAAYIRIGNVNI
jgi:hypothetical protein